MSGAPEEGPGTPRYRAFISYSHRDKTVAAWLHRAIETYRIPRKLVGRETPVGPVPRRVAPIFRDRDELPASGDLGAELRSALENALFLVVICSPASAKSHWVNEEILAFKRLHGEHRVLALIASGTPYASLTDTPDAECFPQALRFKLAPDGSLSDEAAEPIAADLREDADGKRLAKLKLIAGLTALKLDDLVRREAQRRLRRLLAVTVASLVGMVFAVGLALYANARRIEANEQRLIAVRESAASKAASDYLIGTFKLSNPATENPRTVTALTILGRSADRARIELADQPAIQARLLATLGSAYNNLGLFTEARTALEGVLPALPRAGPDGARVLLTLANTNFQLGRMDEALANVRRAEALLGPDLTAHRDLRGLAAATEGPIHTGSGDTRAGIAAFDRALRFLRAAPDTKPEMIATLLNNRGLVMSDAGDFKGAEASLLDANARYRKALGDDHLTTGRSWYGLAQNALMAGNLPVAEARIERALAIERRVLDADNPILGDALSLQGQIQQGRGELDAAARSLREAVAIYRKAYGGPHYQIGIAEVYLALVESARGRTDAALTVLDDAKRNYDVSYGKLHANHGDLLVNRATILAAAGRKAEARTDCAAGLKILGDTIGPASDFTKSMAATCAKLG
ncbi:tetratricopeptide repeat protein [Glacieibacterium frigidum]|uniref:Tetratricopeptide repeat protein n=1 Tax=Glacieibacterium frigidum TaxID=2593303 RepID=A0A552UAK3_9SPHN|nr:tetratricopeptide repeat protein [Glacieibacterium frigidum]TRW15243.1 tetratricopeptide repeat protein [Glacieibacterium frigidum]